MAGAAGAGFVMLVRGKLIQSQHQQHPEGHADHHHGGGAKAVAGNPLGGLQPRQQQGEGTGRQHHTGGKAQHGVLNLLRYRAQKQGGQGADGGGGKPGGTTDEAVAHAAGHLAGSEHDETLQQQQQDGSQRDKETEGGKWPRLQLFTQLGRPG